MRQRRVRSKFAILRALQPGTPTWAPEVEFALPKEPRWSSNSPPPSREVEAYKVALQKTLPMKHTRRTTHGLQGIGEIERHNRGWNASGLYIFGVRWNRQWSTLSMGRVHVRGHEQRKSATSLVNHAVFFERFQRAAIRMELNAKGVRPSSGNCC